MDPKDATHHGHRMLVTMGSDERVLYSGSFAKYAAAFFGASGFRVGSVADLA